MSREKSKATTKYFCDLCTRDLSGTSWFLMRLRKPRVQGYWPVFKKTNQWEKNYRLDMCNDCLRKIRRKLKKGEKL